MKSGVRQTPLASIHEKAGARLIDFHGWLMPVQYEGIVKEHLCVRQKVGLFDICHMGEIWVQGKNALPFLQKVMTQDFSKMKIGQCLYSLMCQPDGGIVDDAVTCKIDEEKYLVVVNASNEEKDYNWLLKNKFGNVNVVNKSAETALLALQGPQSGAVLKVLCGIDLIDQIQYYHFIQQKLDGIDLIISRTGYTGEKGVEIFCPWDKAPWLWEKILQAGKDFGIAPIGLGARDTLRLEVKFPLYGNDIDETTNPLEASLGWAVALGKEDFIGQDALKAFKQQGQCRKLVGFQLEEPGVARHGFLVWNEHQQIGIVTSGTVSPCLNKSIGLAYVESQYAEIGTSILIEIRQRKVKAVVVKTPFVKNNAK